MDRATVLAMTVHGLSLGRLCASLVFVGISSHANSYLLITIYVLAALTDIIDGKMARALGLESAFGKALDLIADKALVLASLFYAASRGVDLLPLATIAFRDLVMLGMR